MSRGRKYGKEVRGGGVAEGLGSKGGVRGGIVWEVRRGDVQEVRLNMGREVWKGK